MIEQYYNIEAFKHAVAILTPVVVIFMGVGTVINGAEAKVEPRGRLLVFLGIGLCVLGLSGFMAAMTATLVVS